MQANVSMQKVKVHEPQGRLGAQVVAEARATIEALSQLEPDLAAIEGSLEEILVLPSSEVTRCTSAWRQLYLSLSAAPARIMLVGSIDATAELAAVSGNTADLLI